MWLAALFATGCGPAPEGPCFAPGEACGGTNCAQSAFCDPSQACVPKLTEGSACTEARQCKSSQCTASKCTGVALSCT
jgi:hypothetical protein